MLLTNETNICVPTFQLFNLSHFNISLHLFMVLLSYKTFKIMLKHCFPSKHITLLSLTWDVSCCLEFNVYNPQESPLILPALHIYICQYP